MGYWNDPERTAERFRPAPGRDGATCATEIAVWSGDIVRRDEEGFLYFVGRKDEMIKTSGYRVSPTEIEEVAYGTGLVGDAVALGVDDERLGQHIVLAVEPSRTARLDPDALLGELRRELPLYMVPKQVVVRPTLPRSPNGKFDRNLLRRELAASMSAVDLAIGPRHGLPRRRRRPARPSRRAGRLDAVLRLRPRAADRAGRAAAVRRCRPTSSSATRSRPTRCRPWSSTSAGWSTRFDVASAGEMRVALDTPMPADRVSFAGPGKTAAPSSRQAVAAGVTIEIESETEATRVVATGERLGIRPRVAVRVNPDFEVKGSGMRMGGGPQQFGVDAERVPALLARARRGRPRLARVPRLRRLAEPRRRDPRARRSARPSSWPCGSPTSPRRRSATSTSAAASASRTSSRTSRSTWPRSARTCRA